MEIQAQQDGLENSRCDRLILLSLLGTSVRIDTLNESDLGVVLAFSGQAG